MRVSPRLALVWTLLGCLGLGWLSVAGAAPPQAEATTAATTATNRLTNPSFEEGDAWVHPGYGASGLLAPGWRPWFLVNQPGSPNGRAAPEYFPEYIWKPSQMIHRGDFSQSQFNSYNTHDAGVWQTIDGLTPGQTVEFTVWVRIWTSACNDSCFSPLAPCPGGGGNSNGNYDVAVKFFGGVTANIKVWVVRA